jgi:hypothetical protein
MPTVLLTVGFGVLAAAVAAAVTAVALLRREWDELDDVFAEARGDTLDPETGPAPWSSFDLAALRDGVAAVDPRDPYATLIRASGPVSWHLSATVANGAGADGAEPRPITELKPIMWRPPAAAAS